MEESRVSIKYLSELYRELAAHDEDVTEDIFADFAVYRCQQAINFLAAYQNLINVSCYELLSSKPETAQARQAILRSLNFLEFSINDYNSDSQSWAVVSTHFTLLMPATGTTHKKQAGKTEHIQRLDLELSNPHIGLRRLFRLFSHKSFLRLRKVRSYQRQIQRPLRRILFGYLV